MATLTTNKNFLSPVGFQFKINSDTYPNLEYFAVSANLPDVSISINEQPFRGTTVKYTGDTFTFYLSWKGALKYVEYMTMYDLDFWPVVLN